MPIQVTHYHRKPMPGNFSVENYFRDVRSVMPKEVDVTVAECPAYSRGMGNRIKNILWAKQHQGEVNHITGDVTYIAASLDPERTISTFLDCLNLERLTGWRRAILKKFWFDIPIQRSKYLTVISRATGDRMIELTGCSPDKIRVVYVPVSPAFVAEPKAFNADRPTVLHMGTKPNKNLDRHAAALRGLDCRLWVIGPMSESQHQLLRKFKIEYDNFTNLSMAEIVSKYEECDLVLFASTYEGFGMPIVEANAVGRPVITSDAWSMPEVADDAALLVDPESVESIREAVQRIVAEAALRDQLIEAGFKNAERFKPETIAGEFVKIYREIADGG